MAEPISLSWPAAARRVSPAAAMAPNDSWIGLVGLPVPHDPACLPDPAHAARRPRLSFSARAGWIALLWALALLLVVGQGLLLLSLSRANLYADVTGGDHLVPSDRWLSWGMFAPLLLATIAVALQVRWFRGSWRTLARFSLLMLGPVFFLGQSASQLGAVRPLDSLRLDGGALVVLAVEPLPTDTVYSLYERSGPLGLFWRRAAELDIAEDARLTGAERLAATSDGRFLLVGRGGVWSDCLRRAGNGFEDCGVGDAPSWRRADFELRMLERARRIEALTGMSAR